MDLDDDEKKHIVQSVSNPAHDTSLQLPEKPHANSIAESIDTLSQPPEAGITTLKNLPAMRWGGKKYNISGYINRTFDDTRIVIASQLGLSPFSLKIKKARENIDGKLVMAFGDHAYIQPFAPNSNDLVPELVYRVNLGPIRKRYTADNRRSNGLLWDASVFDDVHYNHKRKQLKKINKVISVPIEKTLDEQPQASKSEGSDLSLKEIKLATKPSNISISGSPLNTEYPTEDIEEVPTQSSKDSLRGDEVMIQEQVHAEAGVPPGLLDIANQGAFAAMMKELGVNLPFFVKDSESWKDIGGFNDCFFQVLFRMYPDMQAAYQNRESEPQRWDNYLWTVAGLLARTRNAGLNKITYNGIELGHAQQMLITLGLEHKMPKNVGFLTFQGLTDFFDSARTKNQSLLVTTAEEVSIAGKKIPRNHFFLVEKLGESKWRLSDSKTGIENKARIIEVTLDELHRGLSGTDASITPISTIHQPLLPQLDLTLDEEFLKNNPKCPLFNASQSKNEDILKAIDVEITSTKSHTTVSTISNTNKEPVWQSTTPEAVGLTSLTPMRAMPGHQALSGIKKQDSVLTEEVARQLIFDVYIEAKMHKKTVEFAKDNNGTAQSGILQTLDTIIAGGYDIPEPLDPDIIQEKAQLRNLVNASDLTNTAFKIIDHQAGGQSMDYSLIDGKLSLNLYHAWLKEKKPEEMNYQLVNVDTGNSNQVKSVANLATAFNKMSDDLASKAHAIGTVLIIDQTNNNLFSLHFHKNQWHLIKSQHEGETDALQVYALPGKNPSAQLANLVAVLPRALKIEDNSKARIALIVGTGSKEYIQSAYNVPAIDSQPFKLESNAQQLKPILQNTFSPSAGVSAIDNPNATSEALETCLPLINPENFPQSEERLRLITGMLSHDAFTENQFTQVVHMLTATDLLDHEHLLKAMKVVVNHKYAPNADLDNIDIDATFGNSQADFPVETIEAPVTLPVELWVDICAELALESPGDSLFKNLRLLPAVSKFFNQFVENPENLKEIFQLVLTNTPLNERPTILLPLPINLKPSECLLLLHVLKESHLKDVPSLNDATNSNDVTDSNNVPNLNNQHEPYLGNIDRPGMLDDIISNILRGTIFPDSMAKVNFLIDHVCSHPVFNADHINSFFAAIHHMDISDPKDSPALEKLIKHLMDHAMLNLENITTGLAELDNEDFKLTPVLASAMPRHFRFPHQTAVLLTALFQHELTQSNLLVPIRMFNVLRDLQKGGNCKDGEIANICVAFINKLILNPLQNTQRPGLGSVESDIQRFVDSKCIQSEAEKDRVCAALTTLKTARSHANLFPGTPLPEIVNAVEKGCNLSPKNVVGFCKGERFKNLQQSDKEKTFVLCEWNGAVPARYIIVNKRQLHQISGGFSGQVDGNIKAFANGHHPQSTSAIQGLAEIRPDKELKKLQEKSSIFAKKKHI